MQSGSDIITKIASINPIRIETALSRFPIHRLAKRGDVVINIREQTEDGDALIRWEISHNSKYGQPGPLAYKIDSLIVNRRIDEATRPISKIIRLGSLREIAEELGYSTHDTNTLKNALYQNAGAFITAKTRYRQSNGKERTVEIGDTRYGVVFTGETLPDGRVADAVYIVLHDFYKEIIDNALTRPLDYDYLRDLSPAAQRLYELLSYQIYAALKYDRDRAKLVYSEFCTYAPQTRYVEFDKVKKQMYKINNVHIKSGYIAKVNFHQTTDAEGRPDWIMLYMPGLKARTEFLAFAKRVTSAAAPIEQPFGLELSTSGQDQLDIKLIPSRKRRSKAKEDPLPLPLVASLVQRGVTLERATELAQRYPERIESQLEFLDWEMARKPGKIDDPAAYLVKAIERNNAVPKGFTSKADAAVQAEAKRLAEQQASETRRRQQELARNERRLADQVKSYRQSRTPEQLARLEADAVAQASEDTRRTLDEPAMKQFRKTQLTMLINEHISRLIQAGQLVVEPA